MSWSLDLSVIVALLIWAASGFRSHVVPLAWFFVVYFISYGMAASVLKPISMASNSSIFIDCDSSNSHRCVFDELCIPDNLKCDGVRNCNDGSDEALCLRMCEGKDWFQCTNGHCISSIWICDGDNDCMDHTDEKDCEKQPAGRGLSCDSGTEFRCPHDGLCIPLSWSCDRTDDCQNGEDETSELCGGNLTVDTCDGFSCGHGGDCITNTSLCDGIKDCLEGNDEDTDMCQLHNCYAEDGLFLCKDRSKCLHADEVCDSQPQCHDSSDEGSFCRQPAICASLSCSHGCLMTESGPNCYCQTGYFPNPDKLSECLDKDECREFGSCDQDCRNTPGGFSCSCKTGYNLTSDNVCLAADLTLSPLLFFSTKTEVRALNVSRGGDLSYFPIATNQPHVVGVGYDSVEERVYWTDVQAGRETLISSKVDGTGVLELVTSGLGMPEDLVIDEINRNVYITDSTAKHVAVCNLAGKGCTVLITGLEQPRAISIHPAKKLILFSDWGSSTINVAELDGQNVRQLVSEGIEWPNGLAVDVILDRVFWSDAKKNTIETINLNGTGRKVLDTVANHPFSLATFEDRLYWSDWQNKEIISCNKFNGKDRKVLVKEAGLQPMGISIYHPLLSQTGPSLCVNNPCSHVCLPSSKTKSFSCHCPSHLSLSGNLTTCLTNSSISSLLISSPGRVFLFQPQVLGSTQLVPIVDQQPGVISHVASNTMDRSVFAVSTVSTSQKIMQIDWDHKRMIELISGRGLQAGSIAYDPTSSNLFWIDLKKSSVMVMSLKTRSIREIMRDLISPLSLLFIPEKNRLLIGEIGRVYVVDIGEEVLTKELPKGGVEINQPSSLSYSPEVNAVFIGDSAKQVIYRWDWDSEVVTAYQTMIGEVVSLAVMDSRVYWVEKSKPTLLWSNVSDSRKLSWTGLNSVVSAMDSLHLGVAANRSNTDVNTACLKSDCSHICFNDDNIGSYTCSCPYGMSVERDGKTCQPDCPDLVFSCGDGQCVPERWKCDGSPDCKNSNDERFCGEDHVAGCNSTTQMTCNDGGCVARNWWCDGDNDCHDGSDEGEDCPALKCSNEKFGCSDGRQCILGLWKCDGDEDCVDGSDEVGCHTTCSKEQFACSDGLKCLPQTWVCDNTLDCHDGSDEKDCNYEQQITRSCSGFSCSNGNCISKDLTCNRDDDCGDGSDEDSSLCGKVEVQSVESVDCDDGFACGKECLPLSVRCNGTWECPDESDEAGCDLCSEDTFRCKSEDRCIPSVWVCDSANDCSDGSDEVECNQSKIDESAVGCNHDEYQCLSGECLSLNMTCNLRPDCLDGSDEDLDVCLAACQDNGGCDQDCLATPRGPVCRCMAGYHVLSSPNQQFSCVDYDECSDISSCSQHCTNTKGHYKCGCDDEYLLEADNRQCRAISDVPPSLLYAVHNNINSVVVGTNMTYRVDQRLTSHATPIRSFSFSESTGELFWSSPALGLIGRSNLNNQTINEIFLSGIFRPEIMVVDWLTGNLYYSRQQDPTIAVCSRTESAGCMDLVTLPIQTVTHLAADPKAGKMFAAGYSRHPGHYPKGAIYPLTMDGKAVETADVIGADKTGIPSGLALDPVTSRVFWSDLTSRDLCVCSYTGSNCRVVTVSSQLHPSFISFYQGSLYWLTGNLGTVHSYNIVTGHTALRTQLRLPPSSHSLKFQHPSLQSTRIINPCLSLQCPKLCLLNGPGQAVCTSSNRRIPIVSNSVLRRVADDDMVDAKKVGGDESGNYSGITLGVIVFLIVAIVLGVVACLYVNFKSKKIDPEVELRFTNQTFDTAWQSGMERDHNPDVSRVQITKSGSTVGYDNPGFNSPALDSMDHRSSSGLSWSHSPNIGPTSSAILGTNILHAQGTDSDYQENVSCASSLTSLDKDLHHLVYNKDTEKLLTDK